MSKFSDIYYQAFLKYMYTAKVAENRESRVVDLMGRCYDVTSHAHRRPRKVWPCLKDAEDEYYYS